MQRKNDQASPNKPEQQGRHEHPLPHERIQAEREKAEAAHEEALHDIEEDPDLSFHSPNDDLDEGESARLGEDKTDLI